MLKKFNAAGVNITEQDQSNNLIVTGTSAGAIVVRASKGQVNREVQVADYVDYVNNFGNPLFSTSDVPVFGYGAYAAQQFLNESNELHVVRVCDATDKYPIARLKSTFGIASTWATSADVDYVGISATMTPNDPDTDQRIIAIDNAYNAGDFLLVGALGPGTDGQNIGYTVETFNCSASFFLSMDDFPTNSAIGNVLTSAVNGYYTAISAVDAALNSISAGLYTSAVLPIAYQTVKINVYVKNQNQSWTTINAQLAASQLTLSQLTPVETYIGTFGFNKDASGDQLRLKDQINGASQYIYVATGSANMHIEILPTNTFIFPLSNGAVHQVDGTGDNDLTAVISGWSFFNS